MKKYILHIILFFVIVAAIDFGFGIACDYMNAHSKGGSSKQIYDLCMKDSYDVIILGSSRAHHHYVPQIIEESLGLSCYNAGYDGNGIIMMYGLYNLITNRYKPKLIIYDVEQLFDLYEYKNDNNCTRYLSGLKPFYYQPGISQIFKDVSCEEYYKVHSNLCRFNSTFISLSVDFLKYKLVDNKGYRPLSGAIINEPEINERTSTLVIDSLKLKYMRNFICDVTKKDIPLIFMASPRYGTTSSNDFQPLQTICSEYNIPFVDNYSAHDFMAHKEWFKEPVHLNDKGAHIYTNKICPTLYGFIHDQIKAE